MKQLILPVGSGHSAAAIFLFLSGQLQSFDGMLVRFHGARAEFSSLGRVAIEAGAQLSPRPRAQILVPI